MALTFKFRADGTGYQKGLDKMRNQTKQWSNSVKGMVVGAFAAGAVITSLNRYLEKMDRIHKLSQRLNVSMKGLQQIDLASQLSGANLETVAKALTKISYNAQLAKDGSAQLNRSFERLNINTDEFAKLDAPEQLIMLSEAYQQAKKSGSGMADIMAVMGGRAAELIPLLEEGPERLKATFDSATTSSDGTINNIVKLRDELTKLKHNAANVFGVIIAGFRAFGETVGVMVGFAIKQFENFFQYIASNFDTLGSLMRKALKGDFDGVIKEAKGFQENLERLMTRGKINLEVAGQGMVDVGRDFYGIPNGATSTKGAVNFPPVMEQTSEGDSENPAKNTQEGTEMSIARDANWQAVLESIEDQRAKIEEEQRKKEEANEEELPEIERARLPEVIASSLAAIGGGGAVAAFGQDPVMAIQNKQLNALEKIEQHLNPSAGLNQDLTTPEL